MIKPIDWNYTYTNGRDYISLATQQLSDLLAMLPKNLGRRHLDIGCGTGQLCRDMFHRGFDTTGIDTSEVAVSIAKASVNVANKKIRFQAGDIFNLHKDLFDFITCKYVYAFIDERNLFFEHVLRILDDGGVFILINPDFSTLPDDRKFISLPTKDIVDKLSHYFKVSVVHQGKDIYYICSIKSPHRAI